LGAAVLLLVLTGIGVGVGGGTNVLALNRPDAAVYAATSMILVVGALIRPPTPRPSDRAS
ncbi:MAG TPA: hypothetical protein VLD62_07725, partial [Acidimicrobiia bacterium]|nr:hypothetical protein [Acidimicrobiia bacterium]